MCPDDVVERACCLDGARTRALCSNDDSLMMLCQDLETSITRVISSGGRWDIMFSNSSTVLSVV